jgi:hypothetical protein
MPDWKPPVSWEQEGRIYQVALGANGVAALASENVGIAVASLALLAVVTALFRPRVGR